MSPQEAREALYGVCPEGLTRDMVWRHAVMAARRDKAEVPPGAGGGSGSDAGVRTDAEPADAGRLFAVWLAAPGLRRTVYRLTTQFPVDRDDLEAEAVLALLEALEAVDLARPDVGAQVVKGAANRMWAYAKRVRHEVPVVDIAGMAAAREAAVTSAQGPVPAPAESWELHIEPPSGVGGLASTLRFTESRNRREGVRLGALAGRLGLKDVVFQARRPGAGPRIGTLALRPAGATR
ncbi:hypothetical protein ACWGJ2_15230 [Streptomyces sp. NPDC054796]